MKKAVSIAAAVAICVALTSCGREIKKSEAPTVTGELKTTFLKCGKADAIVLETAKHTVVIDTGEADDGDELAEYLSGHGIAEIDYLILTHYDQDHIGGAPELMASIDIGEVIAPDYTGNNSEYQAYISALSGAGVKEIKLTSDMSFMLDDVLFELYPPLRSDYTEDDNDFSIVTSVTHGKNTLLFAGDCETDRLSELSSQLDLSHTLLKVPHHGVYCKGTDAFIKSVSPEYAIITDSAKNPADTETLDLLNAVGAEIFSTKNGNVTAKCDGKSITVAQ